MRRAILLAMFLTLTSLPSVSAEGGVIDSVSVNGNGVVGSGPVSINLTLIGEGGASSSSVDWNIILSDLEGTIIDSDSGNILVDDGVQVFVETILGDAPLGYSNLSVNLAGDVGTPGAGQSVEWYTIIHRLRPLDISIDQPLVTAVNYDGTATGNISVNDGDYARIDVPIVNDGDVNWSGMVNLSLDGSPLDPVSVNVSGDTTSTATFQTLQLQEGLHTIEVSLNGTTDQDTSDNSGSMSFSVGPPPLPELNFSLYRTTEPSPGNNTTWMLDATNIGESNFTGDIYCNFENEEIYRNPSFLEINGSISTNVSIQSRPGILICGHDGARTSTSKFVNDTITMSSGLFKSAGSSVPSLLMGPWHVGDEVLFSMLLRNEGDIQGSASLVLDIESTIFSGSPIILDSGKAGEVNKLVSFETPGTHAVNWSITSNDSAIESDLSGILEVPILPAQDVSINIESLTIENSVLEVSWTIDFDDGRNRIIELKYGETKDGIDSLLMAQTLVVQPGITSGTMSFGDFSGESIFIEVETSSWEIGSESVIRSELQVPGNTVIPQISIDSVQPQKPNAGDIVTVHCTLSNSGTGDVPVGNLIITDPSGEELLLKETPAFESESNAMSVSIIWPKGELVSLNAIWVVSESEVEVKKSVLSEVNSDSEESIEIPWGGLIGGFSLGLLAVLLVRLKNRPKNPTKKKETKKESAKSAEKVETSCPSCDRRLKVPITYSGSVKCPQCETKFEVNSSSTADKAKVTENDVDEINEDEELWSSSSSDILGCPKCSSKLKVPYDRRPATARCPACQTIFQARKD